METDNLNETQNTTQTANPQQATTSNGASNAADFQETAAPSTLEKNTDALTVQTTGEPLPPSEPTGTDGVTLWLWAGGTIIVVILSVWIIRKLLRDDEVYEAPAVAAPAPKTKPKSAAKKKPAKKGHGKKSGKKRR